MNTLVTLLEKILGTLKEQGDLCTMLADAKDARVIAIWENIGAAEGLLETLRKEGGGRKPKKKPQPLPDGSGITEGNGSKKCPTTPQSKRIADIFRRRHTTPWSEKEIRVYKSLGTIPEADLAAVEAYYKSDALYLRRDLYTFLNNFSGEVDRAHAWKKNPQGTTGEGNRFFA